MAPGGGGGGGVDPARVDDVQYCGSSNPAVTDPSLFPAAAAAANVWKANPSSSHRYTSSLGGVQMDDDIWVQTQESAMDSDYLYLCTQQSNNNLQKNKQPLVVEVEDYMFTQQSNTVSKQVPVFENVLDTEGFLDEFEEDAAVVGAEDAESDSCEDIEYGMGEYRAEEHEEEMESKLIGLKRKRDEAMRHYEGYSEEEDLFQKSGSEDSDDDIPIATYKKLPVKRGPTSRSHCGTSSAAMPDYVPSCDEDFEGAEDSDDCIEIPVFLQIVDTLVSSLLLFFLFFQFPVPSL